MVFGCGVAVGWGGGGGEKIAGHCAWLAERLEWLALLQCCDDFGLMVYRLPFFR